MTGPRFPEGYRLDPLQKSRPRRKFDCGVDLVNDWLRSKALQHQDKHLSVTKVLLSETAGIAGFYTLATGQVDFSDLPHDVVKQLPKRALPVAVLAWLGVSRSHQQQGFGKRLLAQALTDCYLAGQTFAFVAVILDCVDDAAKSFYQHWDFVELPGHRSRLFLSASQLTAMMEGR